jgi:hypothetical protein
MTVDFNIDLYDSYLIVNINPNLSNLQVQKYFIKSLLQVNLGMGETEFIYVDAYKKIL